VHATASNLALPVSPTLTILAILLPISAIANTIFLPIYLRTDLASARQTRQFVANSVQVVQLLLTTVLATLLLSSAVPSAARTCLLASTWQSLFSSKNAASIRRIQDAFECCGFNSVRDRAWPFAEDRGSGSACAERFGRTATCSVSWTAALQRTAGMDSGVVIAVGVLQVSYSAPLSPISADYGQVLVFLLGRWMSTSHTATAFQSWDAFKHLLVPGSSGNGARRRLLADEPHEGTDGERPNDSEARSGDEGDNQRAQRPMAGYGGTGTGPRIEPSRFSGHEERNAWETD
jgi:hypothetical protein